MCANTFIDIDDFDNALIYLKKAKKIADKNNNIHLLADIYHNMGIVYAKNKKPDQAKRLLNNAISYRKIDKNYENLSSSLEELALIYISQDNIKKADSLIKRSINIRKKYKINHLLSNSYLLLAELSYNKANLSHALACLKKADIYLNESSLIDTKSEVYKLFSRIYEDKSDFEKALYYMETYHEAYIEFSEKNEKIKQLLFKSSFEIDLMQNDYQKRVDSEKINTVVNLSLATNDKLSVPYDNLLSNIENLKFSLMNDNSYDKYFFKIGNSLLKIDQLTKSFLSNTIVKFKSYINLTRMIDFSNEEKD
jgi:tetratricopeptide (TPR) repeat protein